ncbi:MAG: hypothetical protein IKU26_00765, partial [Clostridia bacterium]|nr:hypothetical protein [Clostridia bacterium]
MKNDRKIIYFLLSFELVLLSILMLVAVIRIGKIAGDVSDAPAFTHGNLFQDSLYLNYHTQNHTEDGYTPAVGYNYYTFSLSNEGIRSQKYTDNFGLISGLSSSTLTDNQMTIKASPSSSSPTIMKYGNLYIQNPYVRAPLSLKEVLSEPLK